MNKKIITVIAICAVILIGVFSIYWKISDNNPYNKYKNISAKEVLNQKEDKYFVYYYMKDCYYCNLVKENIFKYASDNSNTYFVDLEKYSKDRETFDWVEFNSKNDIEVGTSKDGKTITYYPNENEEKYLNTIEKNKYGKAKQYEIIIADQEYQNTNKNAKIGKVYASLLIPEINYSQYKYGDKIVIAGAPTLFKVENGKISDFYFDSRDINEFLEGDSNDVQND
ncbi:MAG: hypothetical protein RR481_03595 [Longicatena sp.]